MQSAIERLSSMKSAIYARLKYAMYEKENYNMSLCPFIRTVRIEIIAGLYWELSNLTKQPLLLLW